MGQYRVIVVDDEEEIREGIIRKIDWNALGYEVVGSAENGVEALELAEHLHPDVIMTDIKMSFMDGLQLCEHIAEKMPSVKMIIFSGFDDFEYAQKAIKLNVTEYLLKPVNAQELTQTLKKLKSQLDQELADQRDIEKLRRNYEESLPVLREQFLVGLLEGRVPRQRVQAQAEMFRGRHIPSIGQCWPAAQRTRVGPAFRGKDRGGNVGAFLPFYQFPLYG